MRIISYLIFLRVGKARFRNILPKKKYTFINNYNILIISYLI